MGGGGGGSYLKCDRISGVFVLSGLNLEKMKGLCFPGDEANNITNVIFLVLEKGAKLNRSEMT